MCGIAGFSNFELDFLDDREKWNKIAKDMCSKLQLRGPDSNGVYLNNKVVFSHTRLSIIDLESGQQPIVRKFNNNKYSIIYNGEIYNTYELREDLIKKGYNFFTTTDTEVILVGYVHYGVEFVKKLNGIFAFAIWDDNLKKLFLFRDRLGIKPLFYTIKNNNLVFGSEIKVLTCFPGIELTLDMDGLREIFGIGPARTAGNGVFKDIKEILPGHYAVYSNNIFNTYCYWQLESKEHTDNFDETIEKVRFLVTDSIKRQLVSDVPTCTLLSGGLDSSIITSIASKELNKIGLKLNTFSFDFKDNNEFFKASSFQPDQDKPWVDKLVQTLNINHTYLECTNEKLFEYLFKSVKAKDLPGMADVDSSLLYFCEEISKHNKVAISGECADEIFGGYPWFHNPKMLNRDNFPWSYDMEMRELFLNPDLKNKLNLKDYCINKYNDSLKKVPKLDGESNENARRREIAFLNINWFMSTLLDRMDRASMSSSLEVRVPYADHRILEYVFNVPWEIKYKDNTVKYLLRKACEGILPNELLYRKKSPYPKTYNPIYETLLINHIKEIINDVNSPLYPLIDSNSIKEFIKNPADYGKPWFGQLMAGPQLMAYFIQINYWLKEYKINIKQ